MAKILIDCDPGHDDAIAILFAARRCDLVGITTVHGNATLENTTRNALAICTLAGLDVPVARGCEAPLIGPTRRARGLRCIRMGCVAPDRHGLGPKAPRPTLLPT